MVPLDGRGANNGPPDDDEFSGNPDEPTSDGPQPDADGTHPERVMHAAHAAHAHLAAVGVVPESIPRGHPDARIVAHARERLTETAIVIQRRDVIGTSFASSTPDSGVQSTRPYADISSKNSGGNDKRVYGKRDVESSPTRLDSVSRLRKSRQRASEVRAIIEAAAAAEPGHVVLVEVTGRSQSRILDVHRLQQVGRELGVKGRTLHRHLGCVRAYLDTCIERRGARLAIVVVGPVALVAADRLEQELHQMVVANDAVAIDLTTSPSAAELEKALHPEPGADPFDLDSADFVDYAVAERGLTGRRVWGRLVRTNEDDDEDGEEPARGPADSPESSQSTALEHSEHGSELNPGANEQARDGGSGTEAHLRFRRQTIGATAKAALAGSPDAQRELLAMALVRRERLASPNDAARTKADDHLSELWARAQDVEQANDLDVIARELANSTSLGRLLDRAMLAAMRGDGSGNQTRGFTSPELRAAFCIQVFLARIERRLFEIQDEIELDGHETVAAGIDVEPEAVDRRVAEHRCDEFPDDDPEEVRYGIALERAVRLAGHRPNQSRELPSVARDLATAASPPPPAPLDPLPLRLFAPGEPTATYRMPDDDGIRLSPVTRRGQGPAPQPDSDVQSPRNIEAAKTYLEPTPVGRLRLYPDQHGPVKAVLDGFALARANSQQPIRRLLVQEDLRPEWLQSTLAPRTMVLGGPAGVGKTAITLYVALRLMQEYQDLDVVRLVAPTHQACHVLARRIEALLDRVVGTGLMIRRSGHQRRPAWRIAGAGEPRHLLEPVTLHHVLESVNAGAQQPEVGLWIIDEGSMVRVQDLVHLASAVPGALLCVGDPAQLPPVGAEPNVFDALLPGVQHLAAYGDLSRAINRRSAEPALLSLASQVRDYIVIPPSPVPETACKRGCTLTRVRRVITQCALDDGGTALSATTEAKGITRFADMFRADPHQARIIVGKHWTRDRLNAAVREELGLGGVLQQGELLVVEQPPPFTTGGSRKQTKRSTRLANGDELVVVDVIDAEHEVDVRVDSRKRIGSIPCVRCRVESRSGKKQELDFPVAMLAISAKHSELWDERYIDTYHLIERECMSRLQAAGCPSTTLARRGAAIGLWTGTVQVSATAGAIGFPVEEVEGVPEGFRLDAASRLHYATQYDAPGVPELLEILERPSAAAVQRRVAREVLAWAQLDVVQAHAGYCRTGHTAQGAEYDTAFARLEPPGAWAIPDDADSTDAVLQEALRWLYTAVTRPARQLVIIGSDWARPRQRLAACGATGEKRLPQPSDAEVSDLWG